MPCSALSVSYPIPSVPTKLTKERLMSSGSWLGHLMVDVKLDRRVENSGERLGLETQI